MLIGRHSTAMRQWFRIAFPRNYLDRRNRAGFLFVLPALLFFGSVFILPLAQSVMYSFYKIAPGGAKEFVGLRLYEKVLTDSTFWTAVGNTVQLLLFSVPTTVDPCARRRARPQPDHQSQVAQRLGVDVLPARSPRRWSRPRSSGNGSTTRSTASSTTRCRSSAFRPRSGCRAWSQVRPAIAAVSVWVRIGFDTMIFLAALQSIPQEYYEAARHRRRQCLQRLRYITLPLLNAQIIMVCILELIFNFKIFDQVYATTQGGPAGASQTIIMLLYDTAFKYFRFGDASVMAVFVFVTLMVVTLLQWRLFRKPVEY